MTVKEPKGFIKDCGDDDLVTIYSYLNDNSVAVGKIDYNLYKNLYINAETIRLCQKDLGITIDISNDILNKIENIEINGYKFISERCSQI